MDASLNLIDLQYLTNNGHFNKLMKKKNLTQISQNDLEFYKKRVKETYNYSHPKLNVAKKDFFNDISYQLIFLNICGRY